jgi:hypothetical protein
VCQGAFALRKQLVSRASRGREGILGRGEGWNGFSTIVPLTATRPPGNLQMLRSTLLAKKERKLAGRSVYHLGKTFLP